MPRHPWYAPSSERGPITVWVYRSQTQDYSERTVPGYSRITTATGSSISRVRIRRDGTHSSSNPAHVVSNRSVAWQAQAYAQAMQTGSWAGYLTADEVKYQERRIYDEEIRALARAADRKRVLLPQEVAA